MSSMDSFAAQDIIRLLDLKPHPEGGHFRETFRDAAVDAAGRSVGTAIYYLLKVGEISAWHRVDATEIWHWYAGAPMIVSVSESGQESVVHHLGPVLDGGQRPQIVVPTGHWQSARSLGGWSLVGCTVSPGFSFDGFEMAPPGWHPGMGRAGK
ncbi:MAG: hypothetical protein FD175_2357 [Beijerinckiaceae bacterium]|nr:MAG: hypothetical protein FD175_2357 [Beijerinckiaceae bacterium]